MLFVPEAVLISMCAPLVEPCWASYIEVFTRTSWMVSWGGEGIDSPIARYTEPLLWIGRVLTAEAVLTPGAFTTLDEDTLLVVLPLKRFRASTPLSKKELLVSRWPLAQTGAFPSPSLAPAPDCSSAFTPGERRASAVKEPVGRGT